MLLVQLLDHLQEEAQEPGAQKEEEEEEKEAKVFTTNGFHEGLPSEHTVQDGRYMIYTAPL